MFYTDYETHPRRKCAKELLILSLFAPTTDLRASFRLLTNREAPAAWQKPNWLEVDAQSLTRTIVADFMTAFDEAGIDVRQPYASVIYFNEDDYWEDFLLLDGLVDSLIRNEVMRRIEKARRCYEG